MLTQSEVTDLAKKAVYDDYLVEDMFDELFEYFLSTGEMPYGVAKARDGDPYMWIDAKMYDIARNAKWE